MGTEIGGTETTRTHTGSTRTTVTETGGSGTSRTTNVTTQRSPFLIFLRLELADALRSKWVAFAATLYLALVVAFVWLGLRESTVLGFTGLTRVVLNLASTVIVVFPLVVLIGCHAAVVRARTSGFCELMLSQPVRRSTWFLSILASRVVILIGPLFALLCAAIIAALFVEPEPGLSVIAARSVAICAALVFSFIGIGLLLSTLAATPERALVASLVVFVAASALHDVLLIATLLRTPLPAEVVFYLAASNPTEAARLGILAAVDPELSVLGPVGFWLANRLGAGVSIFLAVAYPALLGLAATVFALVRMRRIDFVA